jgi:hypothetical protein
VPFSVRSGTNTEEMGPRHALQAVMELSEMPRLEKALVLVACFPLAVIALLFTFA